MLKVILPKNLGHGRGGTHRNKINAADGGLCGRTLV